MAANTIEDSFEEQQRKDIGLDVSCVHRSTQDVGAPSETGLKLNYGNSLFLPDYYPFLLP